MGIKTRAAFLIASGAAVATVSTACGLSSSDQQAFETTAKQVINAQYPGNNAQLIDTQPTGLAPQATLTFNLNAGPGTPSQVTVDCYAALNSNLVQCENSIAVNGAVTQRPKA